MHQARKTRGKHSLLPELEQERTWVLAKREVDDAANAVKAALAAADAEEEKQGLFLTCGCCYGDFPFRLMVQCPEVRRHPASVYSMD